MSKLKEFNCKLSSENQSINDETTKLLLKEKQSLEIFISRIIKFIHSKEALRLIKENLLNLEQLFQFERDRLKLKQNLIELERNIEKKFSERENNDEEGFHEKKVQNTEGEFNKNLYYELNNLRSLIKEYENKINAKQSLISNIEAQLNKIDLVNEDCTPYKEKDEYIDDTRRLKNTTGSNIFRLNYVEKPSSSRKEFNTINHDKIENEFAKTNKLLLGTNEPPKRILLSNKSTHKVVDFDSNKLNRRDLELNNIFKTNIQMDNKGEVLDTHPSKDNKFDHISRKLRCLSNQKQNAFNLSYQLNNNQEK